MSLKKAYDALRIEASNEIMHAAITMELLSGNCVRELRCYSRPSQKNSSQTVTVNSVHEVDQMKAFYSSRKKAALIQKRKCYPANEREV